MKKIYFATQNKAKIQTLRRDLQGINFEIVPLDLDIPEPREEETKIIAKHKVLTAFEKIKKPCLAQDGGFYITSLNGFPKAFVNFALETIGIEGILKLIKGKNRSCEFRDTLAYFDNELKQPIFFETITKGVLAQKPLGRMHKYNWGQLHKIFIPLGHDKTFTQMTEKEMDEWLSGQNDQWCGKKFAEWLVKNKK